MSKNCKKCKRELPQNSKIDICENCQNIKNGKIRRVLKGAVGVLGTAVTVGLWIITKGKSETPEI